MALTYLLDTSVVKRLGRAAVREVVEPLAGAGELAWPGICGLEVGYSARNAEEWDQIIAALDVFDPVDTTAAHVRPGRDPIVAAAEELDVAVLHYDADFDLIASVTGQRCEWVVPAGTVD